MQIKLLQSRIYLLEAQLKHYEECGLFSESEIAKLSAPVISELDKARNAMAEAQNTQDINVTGAQEV